eukprot:132448_1
MKTINILFTLLVVTVLFQKSDSSTDVDVIHCGPYESLGERDCQDKTITCESGKDCEIFCKWKYSCKDTMIICPDGDYKCTVHCTSLDENVGIDYEDIYYYYGIYQCLRTVVDGSKSKHLIYNAIGDNQPSVSSIVRCPENNGICDVNCVALEEACYDMDIHVTGGTSLNVHAVGDDAVTSTTIYADGGADVCIHCDCGPHCNENG